MKKLLFALSILAILSACDSNSTLEPTGNVKISGQIDTAKSGQILLYQEVLNDYEIDTINIDESGNYEFEFETSASKYYTLAYNDYYMQLFLSPGDDLNYSVINGKINISGKAAPRANFLKSVNEVEKTLGLKSYSRFMSDEKTFIKQYDSIFNILEQEITKRKDSVDEKVFDFELNRIKYKKALSLLNYEDYHKYFAQVDTFKVSANFYDFINKLDLNNPKLIDLKDYREFLTTYLVKNVEKVLENDSTLEDNITFMKEAQKISSNKEIQSYAMFDHLFKALKYNGIEDIDESLKFFKESCKNEEYNSKLDELFAKWNKIAKGNIATNFTYTDTSEVMISLNDFKGKYVYIDVWATWCRPCMEEVPHMSALIDEFKGKNIVFMGVSVDELKDKAKLKEVVNKKGLKGIQLYAGGWKTTIAEAYNISSIPRFILIDREGKIINATAERPSENIAEILKTLDGI